MEHNCVFCKIVKGELPATKIYEDDLVMAFLDIAPINKGHALIIPKKHFLSLTSVPAEYLEAMMRIAPVIGQAAVREIDGDGFNLHLSNGQVAGQVIPHAHLHVIPRRATDGFSFGFRTLSYDTPEEKDELGVAIAARIDKKS